MGPPAIMGVATSIAAFVAPAPQGPLNAPVPIASVSDFQNLFGSIGAAGPLGSAVELFFLNGGESAYVVRVPESTPPAVADYGTSSAETGLYSLDTVAIFNLLCLPAVADNPTLAPLLPAAATYCEKHRAILLAEPPSNSTVASAQSWLATTGAGLRNHSVAAYFPALVVPNSSGSGTSVVGCAGAVAGVFAREAASRGVWQAPAGTTATLTGVTAFALDLTQGEAAQLSALALNCLRTFPTIGSVVWGDRTMAGADGSTDQFKYVSVRRMAIFLEQSILAGIQWAVFQPNDPALWSQLSNTIGVFLQQLFMQGAFAGTTPEQSYFVRCDNTTVTQADINAGVVNIVVGFAPMQPAEFVVISLQQLIQP